MVCWSVLKGPFSDTKMTVFTTLFYASALEIPNLLLIFIKLQSEKYTYFVRASSYGSLWGEPPEFGWETQWSPEITLSLLNHCTCCTALYLWEHCILRDSATDSPDMQEEDTFRGLLVSCLYQ